MPRTDPPVAPPFHQNQHGETGWAHWVHAQVEAQWAEKVAVADLANPASAARVAGDAVWVPGITVVGAGIDPTGATDSTAAISAKIASAITFGASANLPPGIYAHTGLNFDNAAALKLVGLGGKHATGSATTGAVLKYTGTGAGTAISAQAATGLSLENLGITYTSTSFTGTLLDLHNATYPVLLNCQIGGSSGVETALSVNLDGAILGSFRDTKFLYHTAAISGADSAVANYSVGHRFHGCDFGRGNLSHVRNGGQGWTFAGCNFSAMTNGEAGAFGSHTGTHRPYGMSWVGCWFLDVTTGTRAQIEVNGDAFSITGGSVINVWDGAALRYMVDGINGTVCQGNRISGHGGGYILDVNSRVTLGPAIIGPNSTAGLAGRVLGNVPAGSMYTDALGMNLVGQMIVRQPAAGGNSMEWRDNSDQLTAAMPAGGNFYLYDPTTATLRWRLGAGVVFASGVTSKIGTETNNQFEVHTNSLRRAYWTAGGSFVQDGGLTVTGAITHTGTTVGFNGTTPISKRATTADATDLATALTLVNALKADLIAYGLKS